MARSDQWIGLTGSASEFVSKGVEAPEHKGSVEMAFNPFPYETGAWVIDGVLYREVVQAEPWSSGPMYFTCLVDPDGKQHHEWVIDPGLMYGGNRREFDVVAGSYYV